MYQSANKTLVFSAAVRGSHVYQNVWKPLENEELEYIFETNNLFDMTDCWRTEGGQIVGHLPREISRPTKFLLDTGAKVSAQLTGTHYKRSPLFQGGLEIPCLVTVPIPGSIKGQMLIQHYQQMVEELYCAPKEEVIMGSFLVVPTEDEPRLKKKKTTSTIKKTEKPKGCKDIRNFFHNSGRPRSNKDSARTIVIDQKIYLMYFL